MKPTLKKIFLAGLLMYLSCASLPAVYAGENTALEYEVKAAFLINFAKFVDWPPEAFAGPGSPIQIGILGEDPFGPFFEKTILDQSVNDRKFVIKRSYDAAGLKDCQMIFISRSESAALERILNDLKAVPVLTISDIDRFAYKGGIIGFILRENKIRFQINLKLARQSGLQISSKVLNLAEIIEGPAENGNGEASR